MEVLRDALRAGSNAQEALQAMVAAAAGGSTTAPSSSAAAASNPEGNNNPSANEAANQEGQDDGIEVDDEITYTPYKPSKLKYGRDHPDPVVENATLAAVVPPDITYNLALPAKIIHEGKLSNLQLEAIVYGCQRHEMDLPKPPPSLSSAARPVNEKENDGSTMPEGVDSKADVKPNVKDDVKPAMNPSLTGGRKREPPALRAAFLLGDGAGMGKGRTLAGFVVENIARGRNKHVWISVSSDLYEDAKRDIRDLGYGAYAENNCYNLGKLSYGSLVSNSNNSKSKKKKGKKDKTKGSSGGQYDEGVMFATYSTLIGKSKDGTRLDQLIEWCGGDNPEQFEGLIMLDECHKASNIDLDNDGNACNVGKSTLCSQTAAKVVELQALLPRARVVYCSATSVSEPRNLGFMSRLGLWGPGTEHPSGFNQFLQGIERLGTGAMELHAIHLKSIGAIAARTLSYAACEFELVDDVGNDEVRKVYNQSTELWTDLHSKLADRCNELREKEKKNKNIDALLSRGDSLSGDLLHHQELHGDSDSEDEDDEDNEGIAEQRRLRRKFRNRKPKTVKGLFWSAHQRFFRSLCIASKVDKAIDITKSAVEDGHCVVIGLQSTGEARAKGAAKSSGINLDKNKNGEFDDFVSAPNEDLKRIIMQMFPLPPKPKGVQAPEFLSVLKAEDLDSGDTSDEEDDSGSNGNYASSTSNGKKRKQSTKITSSKKSRRSSSTATTAPNTDSDDDSAGSDFTIELSGGEESDDDSILGDVSDNKGSKKTKSNSNFKRKSRRKTNSIPWNEIPLEPDSFNSILDQADHDRMVRYRKAAEIVHNWLEMVAKLDLPPNPLDRLLNELGGPDEVAELTGRKTRQVKFYCPMQDKEIVIYEKRRGDGPVDQLNIEEKNQFQNGMKKIAILSEAASTGISLQADKRVKNQRRRVHITLELPWSADKAIQQLGRTHRSNQTTGPLYKFLISEVGGEKRFASAVARRLALLGALTQGDRRATGSANSLGLGSFDMDNEYGKKALKTMYNLIWNCSTVNVIDSEMDAASSKLYIEVLKSIDEQLTAAMNGDSDNWEDNLLPYDAHTKEEETFGMMWYHLLLGRCRKLAEDRVHAIRDGRSINSMMECLVDGTGDKESIKAKLDEELIKAKEAGLNFNVLCNIWLYDVGVMRTDYKATDVSRFLNRLLGMNLNRQKLLTQYFIKSLENEIMNAKRNGTYDVGIKTLTGNNVEFVDKPRSFCFRGLTAKDDRIYLYTVAQDTGTTAATAMELYNEAKDGSAPTSNNEWHRRGHRLEIVTGFYSDDRAYLKKTPKVFLIINPGAHSTKCSVIRPNTTRKAIDKYDLRNKLTNGKLASIGVNEAMRIWNREFELADIPAHQKYQFACHGRHKEAHIFAGAIVPILNKLLTSGGADISSDMNKKAYTIVRVDTSNTSAATNDAGAETVQVAASNEETSLLSDAEDNRKEISEMKIAPAEPPEPLVGGEDDYRLGVARQMLAKGGGSILRGVITKYHDDDMHDDCDPSGNFFAKFSDGSKYKMDAEKANAARRLFEKEVHKLVSLGMPCEDASNALSPTCTSSQGVKLRQPILAEGDDQDPSNYEQIFEEDFDGDTPNAVVGLMFEEKMTPFKDAMNNDIECLLYEKVLMNLASRLVSEGIESTRQIYNLEKAESKSMSED